MVNCAKNNIKKILIFFYIYPNYHKLLKDDLIVYRAVKERIDYLSENETAPAILLPDTLIIPPNVYIFNNKKFDLRQEGLYRFMVPQKSNRQVIVYEHDVHTLMCSLSWIITHDEGDDKVRHENLIKKAKQEKIYLTCEATANFSFRVLQSLGIPARIIGTRTLERWNTYDSGHYLLEVYRKDINQWVLYDLDSGTWFSVAGKPLSLLELKESFKNYTYQIHSLSSANKVGEKNYNKRKYSFNFINEGRLNDLQSWYPRIMQFVFIRYENENYTFQSKPENISSAYPKGAFPKLTYLRLNNFLAKFYQ